MSYQNGVTIQYWPKAEMDDYWEKNIASKRPSTAVIKSKKKSNNLSVLRPSKKQYERHLAAGLTEQDIDQRYPSLPIGWQKAAKERWGLA